MAHQLDDISILLFSQSPISVVHTHNGWNTSAAAYCPHFLSKNNVKLYIYCVLPRKVCATLYPVGIPKLFGYYINHKFYFGGQHKRYAVDGETNIK